MKNIKLLTVFLIVFIECTSFNNAKAQSVEVNFSVFQNNLNPYGRWYNNPRFGQVWVYQNPSFRPYATDGHWEYTNLGWSWVSDFDWGWAPFHYGRWEYEPSFGWMWIPGYEWASAWVSWSQYDDYYGWAPLGYRNSINISFGAVPYDRWNFIPRQYMGSRDFYRHYASPQNNYFRNAVVINNYYNGREGSFTKGPERREVEHYTNSRIEERHIDYRGRPDNNNGINRGDVLNNNNRNNNQDRNNGQGRVYDSRRQVDNAPQNTLIRNNRVDNNIPERGQDNFTDNRPNQPATNNNPYQRDNNFNRPQQQNTPQPQPVQQERNRFDRNDQNQPQNMQRTQQPVMEQRKIEREPRDNNNGRFEQNRMQNNQPQQSQGHQRVRRPEID